MRFSSLMAATAACVVAAASAGSATAAPPACADIDGVQVGQTCQIHVQDPGYTIDITIPGHYPDPAPLYEYVKQTRDGFLNLAKTPDARSAPYLLEVKSTEFSSAVPPRGTQSVVLETYESVGGVFPATFYQTFSWDQGYRKPITIDTLFRDDTDPFPVILPLLQAELTSQHGVLETISPAIGLNPQTYQNFAITDDALIFFFDRGALVSDVAGAFSISVPRAPINSMLA